MDNEGPGSSSSTGRDGPPSQNGHEGRTAAVAPHDTAHIAPPLKDLVAHCEAALEIASARGDKFLAYLLGMTLQAAKHQITST